MRFFLNVTNIFTTWCNILDDVLDVRKMITGGEAAGDHLANMQDMIKDLEEKYQYL